MVNTGQCLVADIGGTNARFALAWTDEESGITRLEQRKRFLCSHYPSAEDALAAYLSAIDQRAPEHICIAVAGPVIAQSAKLTNLTWTVSADRLRERFGCRSVVIVNDFLALAHGITSMPPESLVTLAGGDGEPFSRRVILGPGTGLGAAALQWSGDDWLAAPSEAGHASLVCRDDKEWALLEVRRRHAQHVSWEDVLSGPGLSRLHAALARLDRVNGPVLEPERIVEQALSGGDELCRQALDRFCAFLGTFAGDLALCHGARGGVYLAGNMLRSLAPFLRTSGFAERFRDKGAMESYMADIPVYLVNDSSCALRGAARAALQFPGERADKLPKPSTAETDHGPSGSKLEAR